jgi:hypothetical protein
MVNKVDETKRSRKPNAGKQGMDQVMKFPCFRIAESLWSKKKIIKQQKNINSAGSPGFLAAGDARG